MHTIKKENVEADEERQRLVVSESILDARHLSELLLLAAIGA